ncbi:MULTISPECIES: hypothetical protein [Actinosynnema]|uniref:hypothetical protein n=1 Tax=Actinosynnema TaxID=40566 RepID=UPI0020A2D57F|nr:hypothetical protein [Actinosynnema pretiosum]MCP2097800.1 hypothetical protein [Actinosynnema pretiosum]
MTTPWLTVDLNPEPRMNADVTGGRDLKRKEAEKCRMRVVGIIDLIGLPDIIVYWGDMPVGLMSPDQSRVRG